MKFLLTALFLIIAQSSVADGLYTGAWSYHLHQDKWREAGWPLNQTHNLIAYKYEKYIVGYYKNSFGDDTYMIDREIYSTTLKDLSFTVYAGASYGYRFCAFEEADFSEKKPCPHLFPELKYTKHKLQPAILIMPCCIAISFFHSFD